MTNSKATNFRIDNDVLKILNDYSKKTGQSKTKIVEEGIIEKISKETKENKYGIKNINFFPIDNLSDFLGTKGIRLVRDVDYEPNQEENGDELSDDATWSDDTYLAVCEDQKGNNYYFIDYNVPDLEYSDIMVKEADVVAYDEFNGEIIGSIHGYYTDNISYIVNHEEITEYFDDEDGDLYYLDETIFSKMLPEIVDEYNNVIDEDYVDKYYDYIEDEKIFGREENTYVFIEDDYFLSNKIKNDEYIIYENMRSILKKMFGLGSNDSNEIRFIKGCSEKSKSKSVLANKALALFDGLTLEEKDGVIVGYKVNPIYLTSKNKDKDIK